VNPTTTTTAPRRWRGPQVRRRDAVPAHAAGAAARWPLERVLFAIAGSFTLIAVALSALVSPWWLLFAAYVGVNQWIYAIVGFCPSSALLRRTCGLRSAIFPNPADGAADGEGGSG
jgi:Protein of unknown function (DUF2892)